MRKVITFFTSIAILLSNARLPVMAKSEADMIRELMLANPVTVTPDPYGMSICEDPPSDEADRIGGLYSVSEQIVTLSSQMFYKDYSKIETKVNDYIDSVNAAAKSVSASDPSYNDMLDRKASLNDAIDTLPPRIISADDIYPDRGFNVTVHALYKSENPRPFKLIVRIISGSATEVVAEFGGCIEPGSVNCKMTLSAPGCKNGDVITVTVKYNNVEHGNIDGCVLTANVISDTTPSPSPTVNPTATPTVSPSPTAKPTQAPAPTPDATELPSDWARDEVDSAIALGIVPYELQTGYTTDISRYGFCQLTAALIEGLSEYEFEDYAMQHGTKDTTFTDTADKLVDSCARLGIVTGFEDETFRPDNCITREEAAMMLARCARLLGMTDKPGMFAFNDRADVSSWAVNNVRFVKANEIMNGDDNDNFMPQETYTVEQAILTFYRLYNKLR